MADTTYYVNTASTPGGTGTTNATTGDNRAFASLNEAEGLNLNLTSGAADGVCTINCSGSTADTAAVTIGGWTTDAAGYIKIVGDNTSGKWDNNKYHLTPGAGSDCIYCGYNDPAFTRYFNLQLSPNNGSGINYKDQGPVTRTIYIANCIIYKNAGTTNHKSGIWCDGQSTFYVYNNIIYNFQTTDDYGYGINVGNNNDGGTFYIENNTIDGCDIGINDSGQTGTVSALNNIVNGSGNTTTYVGTFTGNYNVTDSTDDTSQGANSHTGHTFTFVDGTNATLTSRDYHLQSTDTGAIDLGTSSVNCGHTTDIDGETRSGTWDIGADEYVAAGAPSSTLARGIAVGMFKGMGIGSGQYP